MVLHFVTFGKSFSFFFCDNRLFCKIFLVSNQADGKRRLCILVNTLNPLSDASKRLPLSFLKYNDDPVCLTVHLVSQITESILTCRIPDFDVDLLFRICFWLELNVYVVYSNGGYFFLVELRLVNCLIIVSLPT